MPEFARRTVKSASAASGSRGWARPATQLASASSSGGDTAAAGQETLQAVLNDSPAVQAVAQLKRTLNQSGRAGQLAQVAALVVDDREQDARAKRGPRDQADQPRRQAAAPVATLEPGPALATARLEPDLGVLDGLEVRIHAVRF